MFEFHGRSTGRGAYTQAHVYAADGTEIAPDHTESSRTGNHWTDYWRELPENALVLVESFSNTGKDGSYVEREPEHLTPAQADCFAAFKHEHFTAFSF